MHLIYLVAMILFTQNIAAKDQNRTITFRVIANTIPDTSKIFISGNVAQLGGWQPDIIKLKNQKNHTWEITQSFPVDSTIEFKFTRGSWDSEALADDGSNLQNYTHIVKNDTILNFNFVNWKDIYLKENPADIKGVCKYHEKMTYPGIKPRDVIVWLPPGYEEHQNKRYPVLYMHDGQNLFDPRSSFLGHDWQVDETVDSLITNNKINPIIVVGIYNTADRTEEYSDTTKGHLYMKFLVNSLKPFIDENFRTFADRKNTAVGGSSMGGLISFMLAWEYSDVFSKAICMSPAFKIDKFDYVKNVRKYKGVKKNIKLYIDNGGLDLEKLLQPGIDEMLSVLEDKGFISGKDYQWQKDISAPHNEDAWAKRFWQPLIFLFGK